MSLQYLGYQITQIIMAYQITQIIMSLRFWIMASELEDGTWKPSIQLVWVSASMRNMWPRKGLAKSRWSHDHGWLGNFYGCRGGSRWIGMIQLTFMTVLPNFINISIASWPPYKHFCKGLHLRFTRVTTMRLFESRLSTWMWHNNVSAPQKPPIRDRELYELIATPRQAQGHTSTMQPRWFSSLSTWRVHLFLPCRPRCEFYGTPCCLVCFITFIQAGLTTAAIHNCPPTFPDELPCCPVDLNDRVYS